MKSAIRIISVVMVAILCVACCISCSSTYDLQMEAYEKDLKNLMSVFPTELADGMIYFSVIKNKDERYPDGLVAGISIECEYYRLDGVVETLQGSINYYEDEDKANSSVLNNSGNEAYIRKGSIVYSNEEFKNAMDTLSKKRNKLSNDNKRVFDTMLLFYKESSRNIVQNVIFHTHYHEYYYELGIFCELLISREDGNIDFILFFTDENKAKEFHVENKEINGIDARNGVCKGDVIYSLSDDLKAIFLEK